VAGATGAARDLPLLGMVFFTARATAIPTRSVAASKTSTPTMRAATFFFQDPRHVASMWFCPVTEHTPWTIRQITYHPVSGGMLIFPSWLYHGVEPNLSDAPRISLSFNLRLNGLSTP